MSFRTLRQRIAPFVAGRNCAVLTRAPPAVVQVPAELGSAAACGGNGAAQAEHACRHLPRRGLLSRGAHSEGARGVQQVRRVYVLPELFI